VAESHCEVADRSILGRDARAAFKHRQAVGQCELCDRRESRHSLGLEGFLEPGHVDCRPQRGRDFHAVELDEVTRCEDDFAHRHVLVGGESGAGVGCHRELQVCGLRRRTPHPGGRAEFGDQPAGPPPDRGPRAMTRRLEFADRAERVAQVVDLAVEPRGLQFRPRQVTGGEHEVEDRGGRHPPTVPAPTTRTCRSMSFGAERRLWKTVNDSRNRARRARSCGRRGLLRRP
jgi:hypothetical protein